MSAGESLKPTLVVNPTDDGLFAEFAQVLVDDGTVTIGEFERRLRAVYPRAAVHARLLAGEPALIWYVYREGRWVEPGTRRPDATNGARRCPTREQDLRATADSIRRDAEQVATLEEQKTVLDPADPRVVHISEKVERLAAGLQDKAVAERELVEEIQAEG